MQQSYTAHPPRVQPARILWGMLRRFKKLNKTYFTHQNYLYVWKFIYPIGISNIKSLLINESDLHIQKYILYIINLLYILVIIIYPVNDFFVLFEFALLRQNIYYCSCISVVWSCFLVLASTRQPNLRLSVSACAFRLLFYRARLASTKNINKACWST